MTARGNERTSAALVKGQLKAPVISTRLGPRTNRLAPLSSAGPLMRVLGGEIDG